MMNYLLLAVVGVVAIGGIIFFMQEDSLPETAMMTETEIQQDTMNNNTTMEDGVMVGDAMMLPNLDIVDNAVNANNVTTLVAALGAAELVDTLKGAGPFTVFAPTNAAFEKLPAGTVDTLLLPENKDDLSDVLTYHVVAGSYTAENLTDGMTLETVNGADLKISIVNGNVMINGAAMVETADAISSNGVTHVIDGVLLPPSA